MMRLFIKFKKIIKKKNSKRFNKFVKKFYKENKKNDVLYKNNIWNKNMLWDFYLQSFDHSIKSNLYVPYDFYNYKVLPSLNDAYTKIYVQDKNMFDKIYGNTNIKMPRTIYRCMNSIYMNQNYEVIYDIKKFVSSIKENIIIKGTRITGRGVGIKKYILRKDILINHENGEKLDFDEIRIFFKGEYIVQEVVEQHYELGKFHPESLNTLKIMSYRSVVTNKLIILLSLFRIGVDNSFIDSGTSGGVSIGIQTNENNEATLMKTGFFKFGEKANKHPNSGILFNNSPIPNFNLIVESIKKLSNIVPYQRIVGWDFSIDKNGQPIFIESNYGSNIGGLQLVNGLPLFGEYSQEVRKFIKDS